MCWCSNVTYRSRDSVRNHTMHLQIRAKGKKKKKKKKKGKSCLRARRVGKFPHFPGSTKKNAKMKKMKKKSSAASTGAHVTGNSRHTEQSRPVAGADDVKRAQHRSCHSAGRNPYQFLHDGHRRASYLKNCLFKYCTVGRSPLWILFDPLLHYNSV